MTGPIDHTESLLYSREEHEALGEHATYPLPEGIWERDPDCEVETAAIGRRLIGNTVWPIGTLVRSRKTGIVYVSQVDDRWSGGLDRLPPEYGEEVPPRPEFRFVQTWGSSEPKDSDSPEPLVRIALLGKLDADII